MKREKYQKRVVAFLTPIIMLLFPLRIYGLENLPKNTVIFCANHSNLWDPVLVYAALKMSHPMCIMAKKQLFKIPILRRFIKAMGAFPVDRGNSDIGAVKTAIKGIREGLSFLVFPEGTRVKPGQNVAPKGGAAMISIRTGTDMVPVFISTGKRLFKPVRIIFGKPYTPVYTGRHGTAEEYQSNIDEVMRQVYTLGETI